MTQFSVIPAVDGARDATFSLKERLGSGGIASVYRERIGQQDYAIKIYNDSSTFEAAKIEFMIAHPPEDSVREVAGIKYPRYAWPLAVTREKGPSANPGVGYAMPVIDATKSKTLDYFFDHNLSQNLESAHSKALSFKIEILRNLSESIEELHKAGHIFVDLKPQNVRVFEGTNIVTFLDCDGFTIGEAGGAKRFQSTMVSPDYVAPEITRRANRNDPIGVEQDEYALAVMIFQMLNNGIHPFQGIIKDPNFNAPTNDDKAALGLYPHGITPNPRISPRPQSLHDTLLDETRFLLDRAFVEGNQRPTATEWKQHFDKILMQKFLVRCTSQPSDVEHIRFREKVCPACRMLQYRVAQPRPKVTAAPPPANPFPWLQGAQPPPNPTGANPRFNPRPPSSTQSAGKGNILVAFLANSFAFVFIVSLAIIFIIVYFYNETSEKRQTYNSTTQTNYGSTAPASPTIAPQNTPQVTTSPLADTALCRLALDRMTRIWDENPGFASQVAEAKRRGLSPEACRSLIGDNPSTSPPPPSRAAWYLAGPSNTWTAQADGTLIFEDGYANHFDQGADAWETVFVSIRTDRRPENIKMFVETSSNQRCRNPQDYFNQILSKSRNLVGQNPSVGSSENFDWIRVDGRGFKIGSNWEDTYIRDFIIIPKQNRNVVYHVGGRFSLYEDVRLFDNFVSSMRFAPNPTTFPNRC
jgi:serine/threonine protein kinase